MPRQNTDIAMAALAVEDLSDALEQDMEELPRSDIAVPEPEVDSEYIQPWDRQPGETGSDARLFRFYRDLGPGRTVRAVTKHFRENPSELGRESWGQAKSHDNQVHQISSKHKWKDRALAWDNDQERQYQLARSSAIREMVQRHEGQIVDAIDGLMTPIKALNHAIESDEDFIANLSKTDARKLISMSNQAARTIPSLMSAERLARGMPTEIVGGTIDHHHVVEIERDHIGDILEVLAGAGVLNVGGGSLGAGEIIDAEVVDVHPLSAEGDDG